MNDCEEEKDDESEHSETIQIERKWYMFLTGITSRLLETTSHPEQLLLLLASALSDKLNNPNGSLISLMKAINEKPGFQTLYWVFRYAMRFNALLTYITTQDIRGESKDTCLRHVREQRVSC